ncbi:transcriptional activator Mut3p [Fusarium phyllophilum]|uniref:Transcriptional activator Mut3p n=1 Tax=Fusarium phyllophilum TaxID=47803 RepID=A0A8H5I8R3_9HYPO|nr:transcriptional activator Mut3p [Fusarium phyllophilum]
MYEVQALFSPDDVLKLVNDQYSAGSSNCHANPTRWATLNALIAAGIHWKADNKAIEQLFPVSWAYFKNAFAIFPEIVMSGDGIDSCKAMIAMALFMRGTADARAFTSLLSVAAHASHCIGLHLGDLHGSNDLIDMESPKPASEYAHPHTKRPSYNLFASRSFLTVICLSMANDLLPDVSPNVEWIGKFVVFLQRFQDREGCDLSSLIKFCSKLYDIASLAQRNPTDLVNDSEDDVEGLWQQYTDLRVRLPGFHDPMLLARGLLTNMPLLGTKAREVFRSILEEPKEDGFTRLVPHVLKPSSFNFFGYNKAASKH